MQYILTEEEYTKLNDRANAHICISLKATELSKELKLLNSKYKELEAKYNKLLVFGVSSTNERLKTTREVNYNG